MKRLSLITIAVFTVMSFINYGCKKTKVDSCTYDVCDPRRKTVLIANNYIGMMNKNSETGLWAIYRSTPGTYDSFISCIVCGDINDSLKVINKQVIFSGEIKESCGNPVSHTPGEEVYYIKPTKLQ